AGAEGPDEPVVVQSGGHEPSGYPLPWAASTGLRLDRSLIRKKVADSGTAAALLNVIFDDEEVAGHDPRPPAEPPSAIPGLDRAHGALLHALGERGAWTRAEFESLAAAHGVLPDGALDALNEAAIDATGAPIVEGDGTLTLANDVLLELLA
ncbi:MAG: hypothetical protein QOC94_4275, partial [Actinoplanes sp.]|nr:hypothetical protein [Actinoplanes sp.]